MTPSRQQRNSSRQARVAACHGYKFIVDGSNGVFGGTSAVAPLMAGPIARINQDPGRRAGFLAPLPYGKSDSTSALRDMTSGTNGPYKAKKGWDACSGSGRPIGHPRPGRPFVASVRGATLFCFGGLATSNRSTRRRWHDGERPVPADATRR